MTGRKQGFTLMELLVVIVIIGILAGLLLPVLSAAREKAKRQRARAEAGQIEAALRSYYLDNRGWSGISGGQTGASFVNALAGGAGKIPYMEFSKRNLDGSGNMIDPWGRQYQVALGENNTVSANGETLYRQCAVWSKGSDPADEEDDVCSWK